MVRLDRGRCKQRAYLHHWRENGPIRLHSSESVLSRTLLIQFANLAQFEETANSLSRYRGLRR